MAALIAGASYPLRAFTFLRATPELWRYVLVPFLVNVLVGVVLYVTLLLAGLRGIDAVVATLPEWAAWLGWLLRVLLVLGLFVATGFVLVRFGVVLGSPWYGRLSERIELMRTGAAPPAGGGLRGATRDLGRALGHETRKLALVVGVGLPLFVVQFLPPFGPLLATGGTIALGATIACLDFLDPPLERRRLGFRQKLGAIRRALPASAGFGLACFALVTVPFLNLLAVPVCIAAGTLFYCDRMTARTSPPIDR